jgi:hypothetical protein
MIRLSKFLRDMLLYKGAEQVLRDALELSSELDGVVSLVRAKVLFSLAQVFWNQGSYFYSPPFRPFSQ